MRVLIVDGDTAIARALERVLRHEDVTIASNAIAAHGYDLVLGDRVEVLAAMCATPGSPPCVLLADHAVSDPRVDAVVVKPVAWEALCEAISTARMAYRRRTSGARRRGRRKHVGLVVQRKE